MTRTFHHCKGDSFKIKKNRSRKTNHAVPRKWWVEDKLVNKKLKKQAIFIDEQSFF